MPVIPAEVERSADFVLPNVSCLDMSGTSSVQAETQEISSLNNIEAFAAMLLPNLEELDLCYSRMPRNVLYLKIASVCHKLRRMKGNACRGLIDMTDGFLGRISGSLTELYLDNSQLYSFFLGKFALQSFFLFDRCRSLERSSIKNASWYTRNREEVSQEILIKMVRPQPSHIVLA
jgi:hypothetical protein